MQKLSILAYVRSLRERHPLALAAGVAGAVFVTFGAMGAVAFAPPDAGIQPVRLVETLPHSALPVVSEQPYVQQEAVRAGDTLAAILERMHVR
ncbi:MAG: hypothetical protein JNJ60_17725, partial [Rhodocyclaceae bacterium]|nr:hypothetical protein [Rhodocyclaceae bacterium]